MEGKWSFCCWNATFLAPCPIPQFPYVGLCSIFRSFPASSEDTALRGSHESTQKNLSQVYNPLTLSERFPFLMRLLSVWLPSRCIWNRIFCSIRRAAVRHHSDRSIFGVFWRDRMRQSWRSACRWFCKLRMRRCQWVAWKMISLIMIIIISGGSKWI